MIEQERKERSKNHGNSHVRAMEESSQSLVSLLPIYVVDEKMRNQRRNSLSEIPHYKDMTIRSKQVFCAICSDGKDRVVKIAHLPFSCMA
ncbi:Myocardin-Related Transcription Factor B [Manis pentadactyla]|nr:Myocardin-Related Transcription Factor B [Manis pentadactyla]